MGKQAWCAVDKFGRLEVSEKEGKVLLPRDITDLETKAKQLVRFFLKKYFVLSFFSPPDKVNRRVFLLGRGN